MIELKQVQKSFDGGSTFAVASTSFKVERGEMLGLIGESGSGKTTTLKMINRLEEPSAGKVLIDGVDVRERQVEDLRRNIGYVFQGVGLFPHYSVLENVAVVPRLLNWDAARTEARCLQCLEMVGLPVEDYGQRSPDELSGGQQQRVGVARALAAEPEIILMDEPFGALDPITRVGLQEQFKEIQQRLGLTVIMVTHDMTEAMLLADRIGVMKDGEMLQLGTPQELLNSPAHDYVSELMAMPKQQSERLERLLGT